MLRSMTGFASATGALAPHSWSWELRAVNGKGQDLRLRVPDWIVGLEVSLRKKLVEATARGNITLSLRVSRDETATTVRVNAAQLTSVLDAMTEIEASATAKGIALAPSKASDIAGLRGVLEITSTEDDTAPLLAQLSREADVLIASFNEMRGNEGASLKVLLLDQLDQIAILTRDAEACIQERATETKEIMRRNLARVLDTTEAVEPERLAQELALIAVKSDVTEEIDRLIAHVAAARDLIAAGGPVGRKLDFLMQEFNREANTLCAKAQHKTLTQVGLALKAVIDQMREQVQNVE
jgi:uncharacterized protein (TIGR00255 family)